jgi:hypothetical protein
MCAKVKVAIHICLHLVMRLTTHEHIFTALDDFMALILGTGIILTGSIPVQNFVVDSIPCFAVIVSIM